jgi:DHA2 family multidrug resistance protein-like MFS transporter
MNTLTLKDLPDDLASSGNSLLSMVMQLSMSIGVTSPGCCSACSASSISADAAATHQVLYTYLSMAVIIALPACIFSRVPDDTDSNTAIARHNRSEP